MYTMLFSHIYDVIQLVLHSAPVVIKLLAKGLLCHN